MKLKHKNDRHGQATVKKHRNVNNMIDREICDFHKLFCPFARRIFRGALIVTGSVRSAEKLQVDIYLKAFIKYVLAERVVDFETWLVKIVEELFGQSRLGKKLLPEDKANVTAA
jgi:hypothetical protein